MMSRWFMRRINKMTKYLKSKNVNVKFDELISALKFELYLFGDREISSDEEILISWKD